MRYKIDDDGNRIEVPDVNVCLWPETYHRGLYCTTGHYMKLLPTNHDLPAFSWCCNCKSIPVSAIKECFDYYRKTFQELYKLKTLSYSVESRNWQIVSNEWIGESRVNSHRKIIYPLEKEEILGNLKAEIQDALGVTWENWTEFFQT